MSTTKYFLILVAIFILVLIFVVGLNPFSFGDAYFRPRSNPSPSSTTQQEYISLPDNAQPTEIDR